MIEVEVGGYGEAVNRGALRRLVYCDEWKKGCTGGRGSDLE